MFPALAELGHGIIGSVKRFICLILDTRDRSRSGEADESSLDLRNGIRQFVNDYLRDDKPEPQAREWMVGFVEKESAVI